MTIAVCDDDQSFLEQMSGLLQKLAVGSRIIFFTSGFAMLDYVQNPQNQIDILFLDIEMPGMNGLQTAAELRLSHPHMAVAVVTAHPQYAVASFEFSPVHYLIKPVSVERIQLCLNRARQSLSDDVLLLKARSGLQYIRLCEIYSLESNGLQVCFTLEQKKASIYQTLTHYEIILTEKGFCRVHSGAIVNLEYVSTVNGNAVTLSNGKVFYLSRRKKQNFMKALLKWRKAYG